MTGLDSGPSLRRLGLDWLLALHPGFDVLYAQQQPGHGWIEVDLGQPSDGAIEAYAIHRYAIWKNTGAVHPIDANGAASDDPIYRPPDPTNERSTP